ncbi:cytochrome C [Novosphingobium sp. LASN5T]|jgi:hypothetical protein|uniref:cytochrome C n=1 Tax=Novosphingobium sp. LASN5T TaxID=2491021 RepID=UPI000F5E84B8|nr:cytochrome C [Novosphingobium sp. LASN5T]RQW45182.1 cytochrome C [Novosphingobium sp. LASN5T]
MAFRSWPVFCLALLALACAVGRADGRATPAQPSTPQLTPAEVMVDPELARSDYVEHCAGCHGVQGKSAPAPLPELFGRVGWFMCTPQSRAYLLRLPNIAHSRIKDNAELADMMNYVVFVIGAGSVPPGTRPFTGAEVTRERPLVMDSASLTAERARHAADAIRKCRAPASLGLLYPGETK